MSGVEFTSARLCHGPGAQNITILKSQSGSATKQITAGPDGKPEIIGFAAGTFFQSYALAVSNITQLSALLQEIERCSNLLVIRGQLLPHLERATLHRRRKVNFQTPPAGLQWLLIDVDKMPLGSGPTLLEDVASVCERIVGRLPKAFHDVSYHWQLSSSAGFTDPSLVSLHLWFWLDRPIPDQELKTWGKWCNDKCRAKIVDTALFNDVQAHYTAAPRFVGIADPFPVRSGLVCKRLDEVALKLPPARTSPRSDKTHTDAPRLRLSGGFEAIMGQIGDHPGGLGFHVPIIRAVASYVAAHGSEDTDIEALYEVVRARVLAADRSDHDATHVEEMASRGHIVPAIEQAIVKYGKPNPRRKSRQIPGAHPHFTSKPRGAADSSAMLQKAVRGFFGQIR